MRMVISAEAVLIRVYLVLVTVHLADKQVKTGNEYKRVGNLAERLKVFTLAAVGEHQQHHRQRGDLPQLDADIE